MLNRQVGWATGDRRNSCGGYRDLQRQPRGLAHRGGVDLRDSGCTDTTGVDFEEPAKSSRHGSASLARTHYPLGLTGPV